MSIAKQLLEMLEKIVEKEERLEQMSIAWNGDDEYERSASDPAAQSVLENEIERDLENALDFFDENLHPSYQSNKENAARYKYIRDHYEWRRYTANEDNDVAGHAFIGCRFEYEKDFSSKGMLDYHIDKKLEGK